MSDAVLVYPKTGFDAPGVSVTLPLSVLSAASAAAGEFSVRVLDQRVEPDWRAELSRELAGSPLCVGVSAMTGTQIHFALEIARFVKERRPELPVVWGGMHPTLLARQTLEHPDADFVVRGEGELAFRELLRALAGRSSLERVPGLSWRGPDGGPRENPEGPPLELDELPPIPYDLVRVEDYLSPSQFLYPGVRRLLPFQGSRGCPYQCTFCSEPALTRRYRMMDPALVRERTQELVRRYRLDHVLFYDEELFVNARWAREVARGVGGRFTWWAQTRADDLLRLDLAELEGWGLRVIAPGLESGSDRILRWVKKRETSSQYLEANRRLARTGIIPQYNFIIGFPGESEAEVIETVDLALRLLEENPRAVVNSFSPFTPLPGTELLEISARDFGFRPPSALEGWTGISRRQLPTPWMRERLALYRNLMYSSVFLNTAKRFAQAYWWAPGLLFDAYGALIRRRWRRRDFGDTLDLALVRLAHRLLSPVDFRPLPPAPGRSPQAGARRPLPARSPA